MLRTAMVWDMRIWSSVALSILGHAVLFCWIAMAPPRKVDQRTWIEVQLFSAADLNGTGESRTSGASRGESGGATDGSRERPEVPAAAEPAQTSLEPAVVPEEVKELPRELSEETPKEPEVLPSAPAVAKPKPKPVEKPRKVRTAAAKAPAATPVQAETANRVEAGEASSEGPPHGVSTTEGEGKTAGPPGKGDGSGGRDGTLAEAQFGSAGGPDFLKKALPKYPRMARMMGKEGVVVLRVTIDEHGRAVEVEILNKAGCGFDEEAVQAVRQSVFTPARRDGRPVACKALLPIRFVLRNAG